MLTALVIKGLRGIREGELRDLTPLVVLVGPNGSGKSTILEAIEIGASQQPALGIRNAILRREGNDFGLHTGAFPDVGGTGSVPRRAGNDFALNWLFWKMGRVGITAVRIDAEKGTHRIVNFALRGDSKICFEGKQEDELGSVKFTDEMTRSESGSYSISNVSLRALPGVSDLLCVSPNEKQIPPLDELFSALVQQGRRDESLMLLGTLVPGLRHAEILSEKGKPVLYLVFSDRAVPVTLAGDGIHLLVRLGFQLATSPVGIVLLEEPETHLHPAAILQCARAIVAAVRRKVQVILTTHSLELIDALLSQLSVLRDKELLSVYRLRLDDGLLRSSRFDGADVALARGEIMDDLR